jgi:PEP-CTERM motif
VNVLSKVATLALGGVLSLAIADAPARADVFQWSFTATSPSLGGAAFTGSGTLTTGAAVTGTGVNTGFDITDITGTIGGTPISALLASGAFEGNDNLLFPASSSVLDTNGLGFAAGGDFDIFGFYAPGSVVTPGNNFGEFVQISGGPSGFSGVGMFTVTPVPEPASIAALGAGLAALGVVRRRRHS